MNRRSFFKTGSKVAIGAAVASQMSLKSAFAAQGDEVSIESEIGRNHGHKVDLDVADVIKMLRKATSEEEVGEAIHIQGESGHPHTIVLNSEDLTSLIFGDEIIVESSVDAGHLHSVLVRMIVGGLE